MQAFWDTFEPNFPGMNLCNGWFFFDEKYTRWKLSRRSFRWLVRFLLWEFFWTSLMLEFWRNFNSMQFLLIKRRLSLMAWMSFQSRLIWMSSWLTMIASIQNQIYYIKGKVFGSSGEILYNLCSSLHLELFYFWLVHIPFGTHVLCCVDWCSAWLDKSWRQHLAVHKTLST